MFDILEDSTSGGLELDRFKCKLQEVWMHLLQETFNKYEDEMSEEEYMKANALHFADDPEEESEMDNLMAMLDDMMSPDEELESVSSDSKAPTYSGSQLKANNEKGKIEATVYEVDHAMTKTPGDSQTSAKSSTYEHHSGKIAPRKDSKVKTSFSPMIQKIVEELLELEDRQNIGRRRQLFRL